jgi:hypothetical protein
MLFEERMLISDKKSNRIKILPTYIHSEMKTTYVLMYVGCHTATDAGTLSYQILSPNAMLSTINSQRKKEVHTYVHM